MSPCDVASWCCDQGCMKSMLYPTLVQCKIYINFIINVTEIHSQVLTLLAGRMLHNNNVDKQVCRFPNVVMIFIAVTHYKDSLFISSITMWNPCWYNTSTGNSRLYSLSAACALPYIGIMRGLWQGNCLAEHRCPLARPLGMPHGHIAYASLRGDTWIHYYLVMDFTANNNQTISNR